MASEEKSGLMDPEKELTCSVSLFREQRPHVTKGATLTAIDLHRGSLSTPHADRLPSHLLWILSEGVVLMASKTSNEVESFHVSIMSSLGAGDEAKRDGHVVVRGLSTRKSDAGQDRCGEERDRQEL